MNGRVNILQPPNPMTLYDRPIQNTSSYKEAMQGNWTKTPLSCAFFSSSNQQILQNGLRAGVYRMSQGKYVIGQQSEDDLKIVMRGIFLQYARNAPENITGQIQRLNDLVLNYCVPRIYSEAKGYLTYLKDASTLVIPMSTPINTVSYDKTLELKPFF
jgi:hypothetical protein